METDMYVVGDRPWFKFWPEGVPQHIDYPETPLFELLSNSARKYPSKIAFTHQGKEITYRELDTATARLAACLHGLGVKKGDRVAILLPNSIEFVTGYYGTIKAGGVASPVNPLYKGEELRRQLSDSGAVAILTDSNLYPALKEVKDRTAVKSVILADSEESKEFLSLKNILKNYPASPPRLDLKPKEDVAAIEYTGGTTGFPKGAMLTHYNLLANAMQNCAWYGWSEKDIAIGVLPFYHGWGALACMNSPIYAGARVLIFSRFDAEELLKSIQREKVTVLEGAVTMLITMAESPLVKKYDLGSIRYIRTGGMPVTAEVQKKWEQLTGGKISWGYGLSESGSCASNTPLERPRIGTVGIPLPDTDARVMDEETGRTEMPMGKVGELAIRGPQVMKGYLNRPEDDKEALRDGWLYTGDLVFVDEEGYFHIVDRKKETIKYKGYTIAPTEVELTLCEHPSVKECAVIGKPDAVAGEIPKAFVVLKEGYPASADELIKFCEERIAPYKKIREVEFIDEIPRNTVGKMLRRVLRDRERKKVTARSQL